MSEFVSALFLPERTRLWVPVELSIERMPVLGYLLDSVVKQGDAICLRCSEDHAAAMRDCRARAVELPSGERVVVVPATEANEVLRSLVFGATAITAASVMDELCRHRAAMVLFSQGLLLVKLWLSREERVAFLDRLGTMKAGDFGPVPSWLHGVLQGSTDLTTGRPIRLGLLERAVFGVLDFLKAFARPMRELAALEGQLQREGVVLSRPGGIFAAHEALFHKAVCSEIERDK
jgi:hypothetical protein